MVEQLLLEGRSSSPVSCPLCAGSGAVGGSCSGSSPAFPAAAGEYIQGFPSQAPTPLLRYY